MYFFPPKNIKSYLGMYVRKLEFWISFLSKMAQKVKKNKQIAKYGQKKLNIAKN